MVSRVVHKVTFSIWKTGLVPTLTISVNSRLIFFRIFRGHLHRILAGTFWLPANISQISSCSKADLLYINRPEIHLFIMSISWLKTILRLKWPPFFSKPQFWAHFSLEIVISQEMHDKHIKLYIFEISVKFRVDWYIIYQLLKNLKFGLY